MSRYSRRVLLRGIGGATLALPWLEGLSTGKARAQDMQQPYAIFVRHGNGVQQGMGGEPETFWPDQGFGTLTDEGMAGRAVGELTAWREKLLIVGRLNHNTFDNPGGCGHARGSLACLTANTVNSGEGPNVRANGESIDWRIGRELNPEGNEPLALYASTGHTYLGFLISYRGANQLRSPIGSPYQAYMQMVGEGGGMTNEAQYLLQDRRKSVNDLVRAQMDRLLKSPKLSASDRRRLELHQDNVRDIEVKTGIITELSPSEVAEIQAAGSEDSEDGSRILERTRAHYKVAAFAVASGYTRSVAIQVSNGNDQARYTPNGTTLTRFHHISHRINSDSSSGTPIEGAVGMHHEIDKLFLRTFRVLLEELSLYELPDGKTLLDHGVSVWTNDCNAGNPHGGNNCPWIIAGSANGAFKQNQYVDAGNTTHNRLFNSIGAALGVKNDAGTGPLDNFGAPGLTGGGLSVAEV